MMPSGLPTESALTKTVQTFGLGAYDFPQYGLEAGEDSNKRKSERALPDAGGPQDPFGPDRLLSYPDTVLAATVRFNDEDGVSVDYESPVSTAELPGDYSRPPTSAKHPETIRDPIMSVAESQLPSGGKAVRTDYYDRMTTAFSVDNYWNSDDTSVYAGEKHSLPGSEDNDAQISNGLNGIGNSWSNYIVEDQNVPYGHPSDTFDQGRNYQKTNASERRMNKVAVNVPQVRDFVKGLLSQYGKKDLTRRHIMAFLAKHNAPQYLASDVVRCLDIDHGIVVRDVLDEFPAKVKTASNPRLSSTSLNQVRNTLIDLECRYLTDVEASDQYRFAAAELAHVLAVLDRMGY